MKMERMDCCVKKCEIPPGKRDFKIVCGKAELAVVPFCCFVEVAQMAGGSVIVPGFRWKFSSASGTLDLEKSRIGTNFELALRLAENFPAVRETFSTLYLLFKARNRKNSKEEVVDSISLHRFCDAIGWGKVLLTPGFSWDIKQGYAVLDLDVFADNNGLLMSLLCVKKDSPMGRILGGPRKAREMVFWGTDETSTSQLVM